MRSDLCPWCGGQPTIEDGQLWPCCQQAQDAEQACEALEQADRQDDDAAAAEALAYWPELAADLAAMRQNLTHTTAGARRAA